MKRNIILSIFLLVIILVIPNISHANEVTVTRNIYSNNGSVKFEFKGLTLDTTHEYEYGLTKTSGEEVKTWYTIIEYNETTATIDVTTTTENLRNVINATDTGFVTIKDKSTDTIILKSYSVDLKIPFLQVTNYTVIPNGKNLDSNSGDGNIQIALRNAHNSTAYYQYEKITDTDIINKYKEIKEKNGNIMELESKLKTEIPNSNWNTWGYWNGHSTAGIDGFGYTQRNVSVPDEGLYYMWVYFSGNNLKNMYGYILVYNLQKDIELESISLPSTQKVELGKTLTLTPTFNPASATNKIVEWSSSDESIATIDNGGKITPKKIGSTIITVISQDGNKKATCTVTVVESLESNEENNNEKENTNNGSSSDQNVSNTNQEEKSNDQANNNKENDNTVKVGGLPRTGVGILGFFIFTLLVIGAIFVYVKYRNLRDI